MDWADVPWALFGALLFLSWYAAARTLGRPVLHRWLRGPVGHANEALEARGMAHPDVETPAQSPEALDREIAALGLRVQELERTGGSGTALARVALWWLRGRLTILKQRRQQLVDAARLWAPRVAVSGRVCQPPAEVQARVPPADGHADDRLRPPRQDL